MVRATMAADQFNSDQSTNECRDTKLMAIRCAAFVGAQPRSRKPNDDRLWGKRKLCHKENHDRRIVGQRRKVEWKNREKRKKNEQLRARPEKKIHRIEEKGDEMVRAEVLRSRLPIRRHFSIFFRFVCRPISRCMWTCTKHLLFRL